MASIYTCKFGRKLRIIHYTTVYTSKYNVSVLDTYLVPGMHQHIYTRVRTICEFERTLQIPIFFTYHVCCFHMLFLHKHTWTNTYTVIMRVNALIVVNAPGHHFFTKTGKIQSNRPLSKLKCEKRPCHRVNARIMLISTQIRAKIRNTLEYKWSYILRIKCVLVRTRMHIHTYANSGDITNDQLSYIYHVCVLDIRMRRHLRLYTKVREFGRNLQMINYLLFERSEFLIATSKKKKGKRLNRVYPGRTTTYQGTLCIQILHARSWLASATFHPDMSWFGQSIPCCVILCPKLYPAAPDLYPDQTGNRRK